MPGINTESNYSVVQLNNNSHLSPVHSETPSNTSPLSNVINTSSTHLQLSSPLSFRQSDTGQPDSHYNLAHNYPHPDVTFPSPNQANDELMELDETSTSRFEYLAQKPVRPKKFKRPADTSPERPVQEEKKTYKQTTSYQGDVKKLADKAEEHNRLLSEQPPEVQEWYRENPAKKDSEGRNEIHSVANIYLTHKEFLIEHGVKQKTFADLYDVKLTYLGTVISVSNRRKRTEPVSREEADIFLKKHPIEKTQAGAYQTTTVARYFVKNQKLLEAEGISPEMLAKCTDSDPETLRKRISYVRNNVAISLPKNIKNWLVKNRITKGENGKVIHRLFKDFWESKQLEINQLGITLDNMAAFNRTNTKALIDIIESNDQPSSSRKTELTREQEEFLDAQSWERDSDGNAIADSVAIYYIENKKELMKRKISRGMLAAKHGLKNSDLILRIDKYPLRAADMLWKQQNVEAWLEKYGPDKNNLPEHLPEKMIAEFYWKIRSREENPREISASDFIRYYKIGQSALHYHIAKLSPNKEKGLPTPQQKNWLKKSAPARSDDVTTNIENAIQYYIKNQDKLREEGITNIKLAAYYDIPISTFKGKLSLAKIAGSNIKISPEIKKFLRYVAQQTERDENNSNQLARLILDYSPPLEMNLATATIIKEHLGVSFAANTLMRRLNQEQKIRQAANEMPSSAAISWLDEYDAQYEHGMKHNATITAMFCLQNEEQIKSLAISIYWLARRYEVDVTTLQTTMTRARVINNAAKWQPKNKTPQRTDNNPTVNVEIKQEEVQLWNQAAWGRDYPVLISPEDSRITLGLEQGPLRELLMEENAATLKFHHFPAQYHRYQAKATRQMQALVKAARQGTLRDLVKEQGYYYLLCDEEHPELGMGVAAARDLDAGVVIQLYPGVKYSGYQQFLAAASTSDVSFPAYAFEHSEGRPRRKIEGLRKRANQPRTVIGGQHRTGDMVFVNTAEIDANGKVKLSEGNNLIALKAGKGVIAYMTTREVKKHQPLLIYYGDKYLINPHKPYPLSREIKQEIGAFEDKLQQLNINQPALGWLVTNIHHPAAWTHPAFELMPYFLTQTAAFCQKEALLVLTDQQGIIFKIIDSATGMDVAPEAALYLGRPLAVLQNQGENHYNCWWAKGRNVSFSLAQGMAGNRLYQVEVDDPCNYRQAIAPSGFCMSEAAAMALMARDAKKPLLDADRQTLGQQLREQVRDFILAADDALCHTLEAQIPQQ